MKSKNLTFTAILAMAVGIALIIANRSIYSTGVVVTGGILFVIAGILNVFVFDSERRSGKQGRGAVASTFSLVASVGAVVLGVCMIIFKESFALLVPYIFGIIVAFAACYQFYLLAIGVRPTVLPGWLYLAPVILLGGAVYIFLLRPNADDHIIMIATGVALIFFGAISIVEAIMLSYSRHEAKKAAVAAASAPLKPLDEPTPEKTDSAAENSDKTEA